MDALRLVYPDLKARIARVFTQMEDKHGRKMRVCQGMRTFAEQAKIYAQGRSTPGPRVTWAPPGSSLHNFGLAVDSCFLGADPWLDQDKQKTFFWNEYGLLCVKEGLVWGGNFSGNKTDRPHSEITYGLSMTEIRELYRQGKVARVWERCDQIRGVQVGLDWDKLKGELIKI